MPGVHVPPYMYVRVLQETIKTEVPGQAAAMPAPCCLCLPTFAVLCKLGTQGVVPK